MNDTLVVKLAHMGFKTGEIGVRLVFLKTGD